MTIVNNVIVHFKITLREDVKWSQHTEVLNTQDDGYPVYPDSTVTHSVHVTRCHIFLIKSYRYYTSVINNGSHTKMEGFQFPRRKYKGKQWFRGRQELFK